MESIIESKDCLLCHGKVLNGRMVEAPHGGYVCENCCIQLADGEIITVGEGDQND